MSLDVSNLAILDSFFAQIAILDSSGVIIHVNNAWKEFAQENSADDIYVQCKGVNYLTLCDAVEGEGNEGAIEVSKGIRAVLSGELDTFTTDYPCNSATEKHWFIIRVSRCKIFPDHALVSHHLITERKMSEQELRLANDRLEARIQKRTRELQAEKIRAEITLSSIGDAVITTDAKGKIDFINPVAERLTGWTLTEAIDQPIETVFHILHGEGRTPVESPVRRCITQGTVVGQSDNTILISRQGTEYFIQDSAAPILNRNKRLEGAVLVCRDVSESYRLARETKYDASHDSLTDLVNRREFEIRLQQALDSAHHEGNEHALAYIDLDQFKVINDTAGHGAGDEVLRQLSRRMKTLIRNRDTFARLGGDEFGLLIEHCTFEQASRIAENIRASIAGQRFVWEQQSFRIGASMGLVAIDSSTTSKNELLQHADAACYAAKEAGRNRIHIFSNDDPIIAERHGEMQWVSRIQDALDEHRFHLYYQPIVALDKSSSSEESLRFEILVRMEDEQGEIVLPGEFLPAAERFDLITKIDRWVVSHTLAKLADCPPLVERLSHCAINLSGRSLADISMVDFIEAEFTKTNIPPQKICFEVTETTAIENFSAATAMFERLHAIGCTFALDDFGSGLSSFAYLKTLAVDYLKIDGTFVKDMVDDQIDHAMVKSINELGHVTGKITIAEFVETRAIFNLLEKLGVDYAQGHEIGYPEPIDQLINEM